MSFLIAFSFGACKSGGTDTPGNTDSNSITVNLKGLKHIATVDERYQSYNVEMVEVVGGEFWKPYHLMDSLPSLATGSTYDVSPKKQPDVPATFTH
jgi:hypothetical protein